MNRFALASALLLCGAILLPEAQAETYTPGQKLDKTFKDFAHVFLNQYCVDCHDDADPSGNLSLHDLGPVDETNADTWKSVWAQVTLREMPPKKKKNQPGVVERLQFSDWIVGEMQREARHSDQYGGLQGHDQVDLGSGRNRITGAHPTHANAKTVSTAGPDLAGWVNAHRKGNVAQITFPDTNRWKGSAPRQQPIVHVFECSRIKHRLSRSAARTPVLGNFGLGCDTELFHKRRVVVLAQDIFIKHRDLLPDLLIIQLVGINIVELTGVPRRFASTLESDSLAHTLDSADLFSGRWEGQQHGIETLQSGWVWIHDT